MGAAGRLPATGDASVGSMGTRMGLPTAHGFPENPVYEAIDTHGGLPAAGDTPVLAAGTAGCQPTARDTAVGAMGAQGRLPAAGDAPIGPMSAQGRLPATRDASIAPEGTLRR